MLAFAQLCYYGFVLVIDPHIVLGSRNPMHLFLLFYDVLCMFMIVVIFIREGYFGTPLEL